MIQDYFNEKGISCDIEESSTDYFITYIITLHNINDLKKFNGTMQKELIYMLNDESLQLTIDSTIKITTKKKCTDYNDSFLRYMMIDDNINVNVGLDTENEQTFVCMKSNPHWLISGCTGSGKSVFMNNTICYLLKNYHYIIHTLFIDLKKVEFSDYNNLSTNILPVSTEYDSAIYILKQLIAIMENRYRELEQKGYKSIQEFNKNEEVKKRYIFCFIDELAELMLHDKKEVTTLLCRLLQLGRACGIYLMVATQRPSADIISGLLKNNFTTKIAFKVGNMHDSKTAINQKGAELLGGCGDGLLLKNGDFKLTRFQAYNISEETQNVILSQLRVNNSVFKFDLLKTIKNLFKK